MEGLGAPDGIAWPLGIWRVDLEEAEDAPGAIRSPSGDLPAVLLA